MQQTFGIPPSDILHVSAKTGQGVSELLKAIVERVPPPAVGEQAVSRFQSTRILLGLSWLNRPPLNPRKCEHYSLTLNMTGIVV